MADSHRASSELRSIGVYTRDLDEIHALMPPLEALAARGIVVADLDAARLPVSRLTVSDVVRFLETHGAAPPSPHADSYRARLGRVKNTRTMLEAAALEDPEAREQTALAMASYKRPAATRATLGLAPPPVAPAALLAPSEASEARPSVAPRRGARDKRLRRAFRCGRAPRGARLVMVAGPGTRPSLASHRADLRGKCGRGGVHGRTADFGRTLLCRA